MKKLSFPNILIGAAILRGIAAVYSTGFNHPDEHFQMLEPAYGWLHGNWLKTWEWQDGIRSWITPLFYGGFLRLLESLGCSTPESRAVGIRGLVGVFSLVTVWSSFEIVRLYSKEKLAKAVGAFIAVWWVFVYFGVHPLSESVSMNFVLLAYLMTEWACRKKNGMDRTWAFLAGALSGIAFAIRFQNGIFAVSLFSILILKKEWRRATEFLFTLLICLVGVGWVDVLTWGGFLSAPIHYFKFNIVHGGATRMFGHAPWHRYISALNRLFTAPLALCILFFSGYSAKNWRGRWPLFLWLIPFLAVHQLIGHKEDRFILALLPGIVVLAALGWESWPKKKSFEGALLGLIALGTAYTYFHHQWKWNGDKADLYAGLGRQPDLKSLWVCGVSEGGTGGYFYLNRNIPFYVYDDIEKHFPDAIQWEPGSYGVAYGEKCEKRFSQCQNLKNIWHAPVFRCEGI